MDKNDLKDAIKMANATSKQVNALNKQLGKLMSGQKEALKANGIDSDAAMKEIRQAIEKGDMSKLKEIQDKYNKTASEKAEKAKNE